MGGWEIGLCDCLSDCKVCCVSYCCGVCQIAYQKSAVEEHECGVGDFLCACCCPFCAAVSVRGKIREKYSIDGSCMGDCCTVYCCGLCAIVQQTRELDKRGAKPSGMCMEK